MFFILFVDTFIGLVGIFNTTRLILGLKLVINNYFTAYFAATYALIALVSCKKTVPKTVPGTAGTGWSDVFRLQSLVYSLI